MSTASDAIPTSYSPRARRISAFVLIAANLLAVPAILHHPTAGPHDAASLVAAIDRIGTFNAAIHGTLIALMLATWLALGEFSAWRGAGRTLVRCAGQLYGAGVAAMSGAALINGFVIVRLARDVARVGVDAFAQMSRLCWAANQTLAATGLILLSLGIGAWSLHLLHDRGPARALGAYGMLATLVCIGGYATGAFVLNVGGMVILICTHALWLVGAGLLMLRSVREARA